MRGGVEMGRKAKIPEELRLTIELVPETSWYSNMRKVLPQRDWDKIRKKAYADAGHRCGVCGASGRLECHERWAYDDNKHVQKLMGFIALCSLCHHVKHIGLAGILAKEGKLDYEEVVSHFMRVNECDRKTFDAYRAQAFEVWRKRSSVEWTIDFGEYALLVPGSSHDVKLEEWEMRERTRVDRCFRCLETLGWSDPGWSESGSEVYLMTLRGPLPLYDHEHRPNFGEAELPVVYPDGRPVSTRTGEYLTTYNVFFEESCNLCTYCTQMTREDR
jgi:hypothetical protein